MKICLLTYDAPHRKTEQVFMGLHKRGIGPIDFLLMPFIPRTPRAVAIQHRPNQFEGPSPRSLVEFGRGNVRDYADWPAALNEYDYFIVCGSNLIEPEFANSGKILNVHSGLIPTVRGLDSFKWAILLGLPMGNTLHRINEEADAGEVIAQFVTPVFQEDDLLTFATRHYENEIWMLTNFDRLIADGAIIPGLEARDATKRMPLETEERFVRAFDDYKERYFTRPASDLN